MHLEGNKVKADSIESFSLKVQAIHHPPLCNELCKLDFAEHMLWALSPLQVTLREMCGMELGLQLGNAGLSREAGGDYILEGEEEEEN